MRHLSVLVALVVLTTVTARQTVQAASPQASLTNSLAAQIRTDAGPRVVLEKARALLPGDFRAGTLYPQVWIRDLNTFLRLYLDSGGSAPAARQALLRFLEKQDGSGAIPDGYQLSDGDSFRSAVVSDTESSLVQAVGTYLSMTGDRSILQASVGGQTALVRLEASLRYLLRERSDGELVWAGATVDWGDVQGGPNHAPPIRAISVYPNTMLALALQSFVGWLGVDHRLWREELRDLKLAVKSRLWMADEARFRPHQYLDASPFPARFDQSAVSVHGGAAVAAHAGLLSNSEIKASLARQDADVAAAHANSIGLTIWPFYPGEAFPATPGGKGLMQAGVYQNGGDWDWFGARMVQVLVDLDPAAAYREIKPMVARVLQAGGFYEWWDLAGNPHGSAGFRGAAGVLGWAIVLLLRWAEMH